MKTITTHATAATVYRWATQGSKRLRAKYRHAETVCRVLNRREAPIMGLDPAGTYGHIGCIKLSWGYGHIRECGPVSDCALGMRTEASVPPWGSGESLAVYRKEASPSAWEHVWEMCGFGPYVPGSVRYDASTNTLTGTAPGTITSTVISGTLEV